MRALPLSQLSTDAMILIAAVTAICTGVLALVAANRATRRPRARSADQPGVGGTPVLGYATVTQSAHRRHRLDLREQEEVVATACSRRGLRLLELVRDRESVDGEGLERPGLGYALDRISAGEATGLIVADIARLSTSISDLGPVLSWFSRSNARLVAVEQGLDTADTEGWLAAETLIELSLLEDRPSV
jgi:hypothetical protein